MTPTPPTGISVHFFERAGPDARRVLAVLGQQLRAGGAQVELLSSLDQDDLWLLVARGGPDAATDGPPRPDPAMRTWRFRSDADA